MSRILRAGTVLALADTTPNIAFTLEADIVVSDAWAGDDHFAGWAFLSGNLPLYVKDLAHYEVDELKDGVMCHNVYDRSYAHNAVRELTLLSSTPIADPDAPTEDELKQQEAAAQIQAAVDEAQAAKEAKAKADAQADADAAAKADRKTAKADVLDKTKSKAS